MDWNLDFLPDLPILMPNCCRRDDYFDDCEQGFPVEEYVLDGKWVVNGQIHVIKGEPMGNDGKRSPQGGMFLRQLEQGNNTENFPNGARFVDICGKTSPFLLHTYNKKVEFLGLL